MGASVSAVCPYCTTTVRRTDRGLENLGKVAALADSPAIVAVGDSGAIGDQRFHVLGKVQLQHDMGGVWEEWYLGFDNGQWGWLAYAQGLFMVTWKVQPSPSVPPMNQVSLEMPINFGPRGIFRIVEYKNATIASAQGELPFAPKAGDIRYYADLHGPQQGFATIDWGQGTEPVEVFIGYQLLESQLRITEQVERPHQSVHLEGLQCPGCGAPLKVHGGNRIERIACVYCGTISETASQQIIARQEAARTQPLIPIGASGTLAEQNYTVIGYMLKSTVFEEEVFTWSEYLLYGPGVGFRWLVDDEGTWRFVSPLNASDIDLSGFPSSIGYGGKVFRMRNQNEGFTDYVLGEFYWKVQVGESTQNMDFSNGSDVVSREAGSNEVHYSHAPAIPWSVIAQAFGLPNTAASSPTSSASCRGCVTAVAWVIVILVVLALLGIFVCVGESGDSSPGVRGSPAYGGGWSSGK